ncbi:MAG: excisionase family DNA-binding protein [Clostridiales bacterium]|nr:excisionase family DNA-binding protein [Clostridiales bacterium]
MNNEDVPIWEKSNLTIDEAALYTGIGRNKLRQITDDDRCPFVLWVGNKRLLKRKKMDEYLEKAFSI